jgi:hypothetical protein
VNPVGKSSRVSNCAGGLAANTGSLRVEKVNTQLNKIARVISNFFTML